MPKNSGGPRISTLLWPPWYGVNVLPLEDCREGEIKALRSRGIPGRQSFFGNVSSPVDTGRYIAYLLDCIIPSGQQVVDGKHTYYVATVVVDSR